MPAVAPEEEVRASRRVTLLSPRGSVRQYRRADGKLGRLSIGAVGLLALVIGCSSQNAGSPVTADPPVHRPSPGVASVDSARLLGDLRFLSATALEGRGVGTAGNAMARDYIVEAYREAGLERFEEEYLHPFPIDGLQEGGANVVGFVRGTDPRERYIVVSAHYDHLGIRNGTAYPGADDNASGTAAMIEISRAVAGDPGQATIVFAALDAEEIGLQGARAFVADPPVPLERIVLNINLDMVSRNEAGELYVAGTYHYPELSEPLAEVTARSELIVLPGHDRPDLPPGEDWTHLSDHAAFHAAGIPFVYFGVEDHSDYHQPTDTFENIDPWFFVRATRTILDLVREVDRWNAQR